MAVATKKPCTHKRNYSADPSFHSGFFCHCSTCRSFHRLFVKDIDVLGKVQASVRRKSGRQVSKNAFVDSFKTMQHKTTPRWLKIGDRVTAKGTYTGIVKYIGPLDDQKVAPTIYVGIQLDSAIGLHCGIVNGKRYFETPKGRGLMVKYEEVTKRRPPEKCPPVQGNSMFPSFEPGKYAKLWAESDVGSPVNQTESWKERGRVESAPPPKTLEEQETSAKAQKSWSIARSRISLMFRLDGKGTQRNRPDQLAPKLLQRISTWEKGLGPTERADKLAQTLKKLHLAHERGKQEMEMEEERERARLEKERRAVEAAAATAD